MDATYGARCYIEIMQKVDDIFDYHNSGGVVDQDLIIDCYALSVEIHKEIVRTHRFIGNNYLIQLKSPELDSLLPVDFARLVKQIGEDNPPNTDLEGLGLPSEFICVFSSWQLGKAIEACDKALALDSTKKKVLDFVESRIGYVAPNLCAIVGNAITVKLVGAAGGLRSLIMMPSEDMLRLGSERKFYVPHFYPCEGYVEQSEIIRNAPSSLRGPACGMVKFAAHLDSTRQYPTGLFGTSYREDFPLMLEEFHKKLLNKCSPISLFKWYLRRQRRLQQQLRTKTIPLPHEIERLFSKDPRLLPAWTMKK